MAQRTARSPCQYQRRSVDYNRRGARYCLHKKISEVVKSVPSLSTAITSLPATALAVLIRQKQFSPVEVVNAYLQRVEEVNPAINAFACINTEEARAQACRAESIMMRGDHSKPLLGVPVTIKSCI